MSLRYPSENIGRLHPERMFEQVVKEAIVAKAMLGHHDPRQSVPAELHVSGPEMLVEQRARFEGY
jgi:hypothetical protein